MESIAATFQPPLPADARDTDAARILESFLAGRNERTLRAYRQDLEDFRRFADAATIASAANRLLGGGHGAANALALSYRADLLRRGLQPATVNRRLAALRSLVRLARLLGYVPWTLEVENVRSEAYRDTRGPGKEGVRRLLARLDGQDDARAARDRAALRLLCDLGLRRGEVVSLDLADLDIPRRTVLVLGKGRREKQAMTLPGPTTQALERWIAVRGTADGPLFLNFDRAGKGSGRLTGTSLYRIVRQLGEEANVVARPHGLRHTAITEAVKLAQASGIDLEEVMDLSRHRDVRVLMVYRDRERNVQGRLSDLLSEAFSVEGE